MKNIAITSLAIILSLSILTTGSHAGNFQQNRTAVFAKSRVAFGADHIQKNRHQYQRWNNGSSNRVYGNYNTNPYRNEHRKVLKHQTHRPARFPLRSFAGNGNFSDYGKHGYLRPNQRPLRQVNRRHITNRLRNGHWQVKKVWVPPKRHRVWKPGYSNSIGHRVPGRWIITKVDRGYWAKKRVWMPQ